jgi:hypothetical protein
LTAGGVLSGPIAAGTYNFSLQVTDSNAALKAVTVKAFTLSVTGTVTASTMLSPSNLTPLAGSTVMFAWTNTGSAQYSLWIGTTVGAADLGNYPTASTSVSATGLPTNGVTVYVRLWTLIGATWVANDYTYSTAGTMAPAAMISPVPGTAFVGASQTFTWNNVGSLQYSVWVGTTLGASNLGNFPTAGTSVLATGFPGLGTPVFVRLWTLVGATWVFNDYTYTSN